MRILHILSQTELTGAEVYAQNLIFWQHRQGHQVSVVSDKIHVSLPVEPVHLPVSVNSYFSRRSTIEKVRKLIIDQRIDVLHCHSRAAVRIAAAARRGISVAQVSTVHGRQHSSLGKRLIDSYGEYKILVCENLQEQFSRKLKSRPGSLKILRNPFSVDSIKAESRPQFHRKIAFVGRSSGPKGARLKDLFAQGLFDFLKAHPEIRFDIISSKPENFGDEFIAQLKNWPRPDQIQILPNITNLQEQYSNYDVILGAGRVAVEALLSGTSVIAFGEYTSHGLVENSNLCECLVSNFGDIGTDSHEGPLRTDLILKNLQAFYQQTQPPDQSELRHRLASEYSEETINDQIIEIYRAAIFKHHVPQGLPILMYHKVPERPLTSTHRIFVTRKNFEKHLAYFSSRNFQTVFFSDLKLFWTGEKDYSQFPRRPLLITFDDGYRDNLVNALPILERFKMKATLFLISDSSIRENTWDPGETDAALLTRDERLQIARSPMIEIGSHGPTHDKMTDLSDSAVFEQMRSSREELEKEFSTTVCCLAYPFGAVDQRLPELARRAGYHFAVNTDQGGLHFADAPYALFRVNIFPEENIFSLWKKTSSWYRFRFFRKHGK